MRLLADASTPMKMGNDEEGQIKRIRKGVSEESAMKRASTLCTRLPHQRKSGESGARVTRLVEASDACERYVRSRRMISASFCPGCDAGRVMPSRGRERPGSDYDDPSSWSRCTSTEWRWATDGPDRESRPSGTR